MGGKTAVSSHVVRWSSRRESGVPGPGDDDVCVFPAGSHELIKGWLHELRVLLDDARNIATAHRHIALYPAAAQAQT